jgi:uncharacterized protein YbaR (Trm112 family)
MGLSADLIEILRCPADVRNGPEAGHLDAVDKSGQPATPDTVAWFICRDCGRKYPVKNDIPIMLIEEGDKYQKTPIEQLPANV